MKFSTSLFGLDGTQSIFSFFLLLQWSGSVDQVLLPLHCLFLAGVVFASNY